MWGKWLFVAIRLPCYEPMTCPGWTYLSPCSWARHCCTGCWLLNSIQNWNYTFWFYTVWLPVFWRCITYSCVALWHNRRILLHSDVRNMKLVAGKRRMVSLVKDEEMSGDALFKICAPGWPLWPVKAIWTEAGWPNMHMLMCHIVRITAWCKSTPLASGWGTSRCEEKCQRLMSQGVDILPTEQKPTLSVNILLPACKVQKSSGN